MKRAAEIDDIPPAKRRITCESDNVQALCDAIIANDELKIGEILQKISFNTINNKKFNALTLVGVQADDDTCVKIINKYMPNHVLINNIVIGVAYSGRKKLLEYILDIMPAANIAPNYNNIATGAAHGGHRELLEHILKIMLAANIVPNYNNIAAGAAYSGHGELLEHILSIMQEANITPDYNSIAAYAANGGHRELLEHILSIMQEANITPDYNSIAADAAKGDHLELLEHILSIMQAANIAPIYNLIAAYAANGGHRELLEHIVNIMQADNIAPAYNGIAEFAAKGGHRELLEHILKIMPDNIVPNYNYIAAHAAKCGHSKLFKYILNIMQETNINTSYLLLEIIICNKLKFSENVIAQAINLLNDVTQHPAGKPSLLFLAVKYNCTVAVEVLLKKNVDTEDSFNGEHIMTVAVKNRHLPIVNLLLKPKNYSIARDAATTKTQEKVIDGLLCKITNPLHLEPATKEELREKSMHNSAVTQVVYNAGNVLLWLEIIARARDSTLHATFAAQERRDNPVETVIKCIEHVYIATVKENCGL